MREDAIYQCHRARPQHHHDDFEDGSRMDHATAAGPLVGWALHQSSRVGGCKTHGEVPIRVENYYPGSGEIVDSGEQRIERPGSRVLRGILQLPGGLAARAERGPRLSRLSRMTDG